jgi:hypothetical protein
MQSQIEEEFEHAPRPSFFAWSSLRMLRSSIASSRRVSDEFIVVHGSRMARTSIFKKGYGVKDIVIIKI